MQQAGTVGGVDNRKDCRDVSGETNYHLQQSLRRLSVLPWDPQVGEIRTLGYTGRHQYRDSWKSLKRDPMNQKGLPIHQQVGKQSTEICLSSKYDLLGLFPWTG